MQTLMAENCRKNLDDNSHIIEDVYMLVEQSTMWTLKRWIQEENDLSPVDLNRLITHLNRLITHLKRLISEDNTPQEVDL